MNEIAINEIMRNDKFSKKIFIGVYARNELPRKVPYPSCFVFNTQPRSESGEHWLALFYNSHGKCSFFDSYGLNPELYNLKKYIITTSNGRFDFNMKRVQGDSMYCGLYCVFFLILKSRNSSRLFYNYFTTNLKKNDKRITKLLNEM